MIQCNRKVVNFVDNLKENNKLTYVNTESSHLPSIVKQLPKSIELQLSELYSNKEVFKNSVKRYKEALKKAGYKHEMRYQQNIR